MKIVMDENLKQLKGEKMIKQKKGLFSGIILGFFALMVFCVNAKAYIMANYSDSIFTTSGSREAAPEIKTNIIESADYFLKSYSDFLVLLSKIERAEMDDIDYTELAALFDSCVSRLENSRDAYAGLIGKAEITPYNKNVMKKLRGFDYAAFLENHSLNPSIFKEVSAYLRKADIRGLYSQILANVEEILVCCDEIRIEINETRFPKISGLWDLNSLFSRTLIFGQYTAMIFNKIMTDS